MATRSRYKGETTNVMSVRYKAKTVCHHGPTNTYRVATPIGEMIIISCPKGLHSLGQNPEITENTFKPDRRLEVQLVTQLYDDNGYTYTPALDCIQWLKYYFAKEHTDKLPSFCPSILKGTFTGKVLQKLIEVAPFGKTISYKSLSQAAGNGSAFRAVGQAMASNPIQLVIPCHRVICSDGTIGNYAKGHRNYVKNWLLQFERGEI